MKTYTVYVVKVGNAVIDSFTTEQWLTDALAKEKARAKRDAYNAFNAKAPLAYTIEPARIVRCFRQSRAHHL